MLADKMFVDFDVVESEVDERTDVGILLFVKSDGYFVDDSVSSSLTHFAFHILGLIRANVVLRQNLFDLFEPLLKRFLIVSSAVLPDEVFEHISGDVHSRLDILNKILPDDASGKDVESFLIDVLSSHYLRETEPGAYWCR